MIATPSFFQFGLGAILAAVIAGGFSILGLIISKELKVSDFRREWTEELRAEIARFMANANLVTAMVMTKPPPDLSEAQLLTVFRSEIVAMLEASSRIRLRLDEADPVARPILVTLRTLEEMVQGATPPPSDQLLAVERLLVSQSRVLMRREWHRVRNGEAVYRTARTVAVAVTTAGSLGLCAAAAWALAW